MIVPFDRRTFRCRPLFALAAALILFVGSTGIAPSALPCARCGPHCPMSAKRLSCHETGMPAHGCHDAGGPRLVSCTHSSEVAPGLSWLAVPVPSASLRLGVSVGEFIPEATPLAGRDVPDPLLEPPRLRVVI
jgi:hypothetical protein